MSTTMCKSPARRLAIDDNVNANNKSPAWMLAATKVQQGCWHQQKSSADAGNNDTPALIRAWSEDQHGSWPSTTKSMWKSRSNLVIDANVDEEESSTEAGRRL